MHNLSAMMPPKKDNGIFYNQKEGQFEAVSPEKRGQIKKDQRKDIEQINSDVQNWKIRQFEMKE